MAGIGFRLKRLFDQESYISLLTGYLYSVVIATGPWLFSIMALAILSLYSGRWLAVADENLFRAVIIYSFAYSLIFIGPFQLIFTRQVADLLYADRLSELSPTVTGMFQATLWASFLPAAVFYGFSPYSLLFKVLGTTLFVAICGIWLSMIFLEALRDFASVLHAFLIGSALSVALGIAMGSRWGLEGHLGGFTLGQVVLFLYMLVKIFRDFGLPSRCDLSCLGLLGKHPLLLGLGVCYNLGIWADKIIYWVSPSGLHVGYLFFDHYPYDTAVFIAYLTAIPSLAYFLMVIEIEFYERYRSFFGGILRKRSLTTIEHMRTNIVSTLRRAFLELLKIQGTVTALVFFLAPWIVKPLGATPQLITALRMATLAVFFHVFLLLFLILLMYFEFYREALVAAGIFLFTNVIATILVILIVPQAIGLGYLISCAISAVVAMVLATGFLRNLTFETFARQPVLQENSSN